MKNIAEQISKDIDLFCAEKYNDGHRNHLGASLIGDECKRKLWYVFRWVKAPDFDGRMQRLFNRGHREEDRFIEWLEGIGCKVWADDLTTKNLVTDTYGESYGVVNKEGSNEFSKRNVSDSQFHINRAKADGVKFPQYRISAVAGHFGGSLDGICRLPERYGINEPVLLEFKTASDNAFKKLKSKGMVIEKPLHFAQTSTYGSFYGFNYVLYMCINKNTDEIHVELVKLDHNLGKQMVMKAEQIITSKTPPPKLSFDETFWTCKYCDFHTICHKGGVAEVNCRSCKHCLPVEDGDWMCTANGGCLGKDDILKVCECYEGICDNV